jgi:hypothetical protein
MKTIAKIILGAIAMVAIGFLFNEKTEGFIACIAEKLIALTVLAGCTKGYLALINKNESDYSNEH